MMPLVRIGLWIGIPVVALSSLAVPKLVDVLRSADRSVPADGSTAPLPVEVHIVARERMAQKLSSTGTLIANERVDVVSEIAGKVSALQFEEGARVAAGALLVQIDDRELRAQQEELSARLDLAERRAERQRQLYHDELISDEEFEAAVTEADALRAELRLIEVRLAKTQIRAPFAGTVGLRGISEGAYISPQTLVTTVVDIDPIKLDFAVPERYAAEFRPGKSMEFRVAAVEGPRQATVYAVAPSVDPETRTMTVRATSVNPDGALRPGAFADVTFAVREIDDTLAVPSIAVILGLGGRRVYVLEDGVAQERSVETGLRTRDRIEIVSGIAVGDQVIVSGLQSLRPGMKVEVVSADARESGL